MTLHREGAKIMEEIELDRLAMADGSNMVLTTRHVYQHKDSGWRGDSKVIIPREAITSVTIAWRRRLVFLFVGATLLAVAAALHVFSFQLSLPEFVAPVLAGFGVLIMLITWARSNTIQIIAPGATIEGQANNYDAARRFCALLLSPVHEPLPREDDEKATIEKRDPLEPKWEL
jgi:hypothetical protein